MPTSEDAPEREALLALGSNLGDPAAHLAEAARRLGELGEVVAASSTYRTEPVGFREQPDFLNQVIVLRTRLDPESLLAGALRIERAMGRERPFRDAPRTIDIDILDVGGEMVRRAGLVLPHPRLHERAFVLAPLTEVAPEWRHPHTGRTAAELLQNGAPWPRVERVGDEDTQPNERASD